MSAPYRRPGPARLASFALAGLLWGCLAWVIGFRVIEVGPLMGVAASPLIGLALGAGFQGRFERASWSGQVGLALVTLYLGATLFALVVGLGNALSGGGGSGDVRAVVAGVWYGATVLLIVLYPLIYFTHLALASDSAWWRTDNASPPPR